MKDNPQNQVKLSQLRILVAVAEQQSFSEAALELGISQSAVSHAVSALEDRLGVMLFSRGRHGATPTPVGDRIVQHAQVVVERTAAILKEASLAKGLEQGQVRVAAFRSIATHVLPSIIAQFHQRFPGIALYLTEHDDYLQVEQALRSGRADIGITFMPVGKGLMAWELLQDEFIALLPPSFELQGERLTWAELVAQPMIMPPVDYIMMRPVYDYINGLGYWLNVVYEVETDATIVSLVAQGLGATILPRLAAEPIPEAVRVYPLPAKLARSVGVAILTEAQQPPAVYALLETLKAEAVA
ncbi:MAG: LysR family transcriptional regulator [Leptolyngbya sp. SIO4C1]|nr:LysR family transcriptional regulator [Leptolyngbya sp. SIO4C1]